MKASGKYFYYSNFKRAISHIKFCLNMKMWFCNAIKTIQKNNTFKKVSRLLFMRTSCFKVFQFSFFSLFSLKVSDREELKTLKSLSKTWHFSKIQNGWIYFVCKKVFYLLKMRELSLNVKYLERQGLSEFVLKLDEAINYP